LSALVKKAAIGEVMFKRTLLCYDGSDRGRRALVQGAELAISIGSQISVLAIVPESVENTVAMSRITGHAGFDAESDFREILEESVAWLKARGVSADAHLAHGNVIDVILKYARELSIDLIVVGQYPSPRAKRWWSSAQHGSLSEHARCSIFISIDA
jgi:nucleotide-binding universal stress UspA family protein